MSVKKGFECVDSSEKIVVDLQLRDFLLPITRRAEALAVRTVAPHFGEDGEVYFPQERIDPDGNIFYLPKVRTMSQDNTLKDRDISFSKNNPRIVSKGA